MKQQLRVLIVEDFQADALLILRELGKGGFDVVHRLVDRVEDMQRALSMQDWDLVIGDYSMPHFDGMLALETLKRTGLDIPFILVSGKIGEQDAVDAMKAGAHDYIMKGNLARLVPAIQRELREAKVRSEHRSIEQKLKLTERLRYVGSLTASIIHDLKQPMQVILSCTESIETEDLSPEERVGASQEITKQVRRMLSMSQEILDFSSGDRKLSLVPVDVDELCREVVDSFNPILARDKIVVTYSKWANELITTKIMLDRDRFWRVLINLISNAHEAMPHGGGLTIRLSIDLRGTNIEVQDTGCGIPETITTTLFDPFVTHGKQEGTGLGLAIVKSIIDSHQGSISFKSVQGEGTTFTISLPRSSMMESSGSREFERAN